MQPNEHPAASRAIDREKLNAAIARLKQRVTTENEYALLAIIENFDRRIRELEARAGSPG